MRTQRVTSIALVLLLALSIAVGAQSDITITIGIAETARPEGLDFIENVLIPQFEAENPGIKVQMDVIRWSYDTYVTRYIAGEAPDAFQMGGDRAGTYADMLEPLNKYVANIPDMGDFPPVLIDGWTIGGNLYGIPWSMPIRNMFYRTDYFLEAGLDPNTPPATWDDIVDYGRRLTQFSPDGVMTRQGISVSDHWLDIAQWVFQAGGDYMNADRTAFTFGSEAAQEAAQFLSDLVNLHQIASHMDNDLGEIRENRTAMEPRQATILIQDEWRDTIGIAPAITHKEQAVTAYANGWGITNTSPHKDAAWKWIEFVTNIDNMVAYSVVAQIMPPRMSVVNYPPFSDDPRFLQLYENTLVAKGLPFESPYIDQARRDYITPTFRAIMYEGAPVTDLAEAERLANAVFGGN